MAAKTPKKTLVFKAGAGKGIGAALLEPARKTSVGPGGRTPLPALDPDYVRFRAVSHEELGLTIELGDDVIAPTGYPTRDTLSNPTISTPAGAPPLGMRIPLLFDRWTQLSASGIQLSIEPEMRMLDDLYGLATGVAPTLTIEGRTIPHSYERDPDLRWALTGDPEYGDVRKKANGDRVYAEIAVTVVQVSRASVTPDPKPDPKNPKPHHYTVPKTGGYRTLKTIAKHYRTTTAALRKLNPQLKDPAHHLPAGTKVRYS